MLKWQRLFIIVEKKGEPAKTLQELDETWGIEIYFRSITYDPVKVHLVSKTKLRVEFDSKSHCRETI